MADERLSEYLYSLLDSMQSEKERGCTVPKMVTRGELFSAVDRDVREVLNGWFREGRIRVHKTVHSKSQDYVELIRGGGTR